MNETQSTIVGICGFILIILAILLIMYFAIGIRDSTGVAKEDYISGLSMFLPMIVSCGVIIGILSYDLVEQTNEAQDYSYELLTIKKHFGLPINQKFQAS